MPSAITFKITDVGYTAALDADTAGLDLRIAEIAIGSGQYTPDGTETDLVDEIQRWNVADGDVIPSTNTLRFAAILESATRESAFEIGLFDEDDVLFAVASTVAVDPLMELYPNVANVGVFGLALGDIPSGTITITLDPSAPLALVLLAQHIAAVDPHIQYLTKVRATANGIDADLGVTNKFTGNADTLLATGKYYVDPASTNQAFGALGEIISVDREDEFVVYQTSQCVNGQGKATRCLFNRIIAPTGWTDWDYSVTASTAAKAAAFVAEVEWAYPRLIAAGNFSSDAAGVILSSNQTAGWTLAKHPSDAGAFIVSHASIAIDDTKHSLAATIFGSSAEGFGSWGTTSFDTGDMIIDSQFTAGTPTWQVSGSWQIFQFAV